MVSIRDDNGFAIFNHLFANRERKSANREIKLHELSVVTKQTVKITRENRMLFLCSFEMMKALNVFHNFRHFWKHCYVRDRQIEKFA